MVRHPPRFPVFLSRLPPSLPSILQFHWTRGRTRAVTHGTRPVGDWCTRELSILRMGKFSGSLICSDVDRTGPPGNRLTLYHESVNIIKSYLDKICSQNQLYFDEVISTISMRIHYNLHWWTRHTRKYYISLLNWTDVYISYIIWK